MTDKAISPVRRRMIEDTTVRGFAVKSPLQPFSPGRLPAD